MPDPIAVNKLTPLPARAAGHPPSTLVAVSGGRTGVGATTLALGLAKSLAHDALRIVVIDADRQRATLAASCGLAAGPGIDEVLSGRKSIHEALARGPLGLQVLCGAPSPSGLSISQRAIDRLMRQIQTLARHTDVVIVDSGNEPTDLAARLWEAADELVLVTSPEAASVMDAYALVKQQLTSQRVCERPTLVVSRAVDAMQAADVHRRIDQSCRRFLEVPVDYAGFVPATLDLDSDRQVAQAHEQIARQLMARRDGQAAPPLAA